jgi:hypothetical protein
MKDDLGNPSLISPNLMGLVLVVLAIIAGIALSVWIHPSTPGNQQKRATGFPAGWHCEQNAGVGVKLCDREASKPDPTTRVVR